MLISGCSRSIRTTQFPIYNYGELNIDETSRKLSLEDKTVNLTRAGIAILKLLIQNPGQVILQRLLKIINDTASLNNTAIMPKGFH